MPGLSHDLIEHALKTAQHHGYRFVSVKSEGERFTATFDVAPVTRNQGPEHLETGEEASEPKSHEVKAGSVGFFALADVEVGSQVEPGAIIGAVTGLGLRNEVTVTKGGTLVEVLVEDGEAVEFGQVIAKVAE